MTKKKFSLHEKLKTMTKGTSESSFADQTWSIYPPIIEASDKFDFNYDISEEEVLPPTFNKEKFESKANQSIELHPLPSINNEEKSSSVEKTEITALKKVRKKDLDDLSISKKDIKNLSNIKQEIEKKLVFETEKNSKFRESLSEAKDQVRELSKNLDSLKRDQSNLEIENSSVQNELERIEANRLETEVLITKLGKENGALSERLAGYHRDKNEVENVYQANLELIKNYKKQIIINKESISSLLSDIDFKNKEIDQKNESIEVLKSDIEENRELETKITADLDQSIIEFKRAEKELSQLKEKKNLLLQEISEVEASSRDYGNKKAALFSQLKSDEATFFTLMEDLKSLKGDVESKKSIVSSHESKIFQIQKSISEYENQKIELEDSLIKRKQEIHKFTSVYAAKANRLEQLESENFNLKREAESLLSTIEEGKIQKSTLERKLNQLKVENGKSTSLITLFTKELSSISTENNAYEDNIRIAVELRESNLVKMSNLRKEVDRLTKGVEVKQVQLGNLQTNTKRQSEQVSNLKIKRDERSEKLQDFTNKFNEEKFKIKESLKDKKVLVKDIIDLNESINIASDKLTVYQNLLVDCKTKKLNKYDEKISLEQKVNLLTTNVQEAESELYTEKSILSSIQGELDEVLKRNVDLKVKLNSQEQAISKLRRKKNEISDISAKAFVDKQSLENEILELERVKGTLESELMRDQEVYSDLNSKFISIESRHNRLKDAVSEASEERAKLVGQIETRTQLISKKEEESLMLSKELQRLELEVDSYKSEFNRSNTNLINTNLNVSSMREGIRAKKEELREVKLKYASLSNNTNDLNIDKEQQLVLIDELEKTKTRYVNLIEDMVSKKAQEESKIAEGNQYIERLKADVDSLKENVYILENHTKKKKAA